ncbi:hypothetical protein [Photobacterium lutimaris]|uniref:Uncharacterized protein n=1 Tax=Photobacterium lutimaris TaxID=388278 RepID=A0A2T3ITR5_9GAMM|nr:hypothetical protein [Photobacterium lutimaris]PSU31750.1 hypothetical protein C9I99_21440 [Photobacterium lutimaris]TDR72602.1 hypothetical protein DFP78_11378 [Photobacterium lutimaris]
MHTCKKAVCANKNCLSQNTNSVICNEGLNWIDLASTCLDCGTEWTRQYNSTINSTITKVGSQPEVVKFKVIEVDSLEIEHTDFYISSLCHALSNLEFCFNRNQSNLHSHKLPSDPEWSFTGVKWYRDGGNDVELEAKLTAKINDQLFKLTETHHNFTVKIVDGSETGAYLMLQAACIKGDLIILVDTSLTTVIIDEESNSTQFSLFDWIDLMPSSSQHNYESLLTIPLLAKYFPLDEAINLRHKAQIVLAEFITEEFATTYDISYDSADALINLHQAEFLQRDGYWVVNSLDLIGGDTKALIEQYHEQQQCVKTP